MQFSCLRICKGGMCLRHTVHNVTFWHKVAHGISQRRKRVFSGKIGTKVTIPISFVQWKTWNASYDAEDFWKIKIMQKLPIWKYGWTFFGYSNEFCFSFRAIVCADVLYSFMTRFNFCWVKKTRNQLHWGIKQCAKIAGSMLEFST